MSEPASAIHQFILHHVAPSVGLPCSCHLSTFSKGTNKCATWITDEISIKKLSIILNSSAAQL